MKQIAVFTVILGGFDKPRPINPDFQNQADWYLFTDSDINAPGYIVIRIKPTLKNLRRESRKYKICIHNYLFHKYTIYLDGSIEMLISPKKAIEKYLGNSDLAVLKHPWRNCAYLEARECVKMGLIGKNNANAQIEFMRRNKYPDNNGLTENGVIIRRHTEEINRFANYWMKIYEQFTQRDQISFGFCAWKTRLKFNIIPGPIRENAEQKPTEFKLYSHLK